MVEIQDLATSEVREVRARSLDVLSREAAKWREAVSHPSGEDRWQKSRDLVNSGARKVNAQVFGVKSHETRGREAAKWRKAVNRPSE